MRDSQVVMIDGRDMAVSWLDGWLDEQHLTMEWVCECGPPIVLILKISLEQAFFQFLPFTLSLCCSEPYH